MLFYGICFLVEGAAEPQYLIQGLDSGEYLTKWYKKPLRVYVKIICKKTAFLLYFSIKIIQPEYRTLISFSLKNFGGTVIQECDSDSSIIKLYGVLTGMQ